MILLVEGLQLVQFFQREVQISSTRYLGPVRSFFCGVKNAKVDDSSAFHNVVALLSLPLPNARLEDEVCIIGYIRQTTVTYDSL